jgi:hypothetical protein
MFIEMLKFLHRTTQSLYSNYVPCIIHNNSSSIHKTTKTPRFLRMIICKYPHTRTQASLTLFIPNHPLCRQGKSLELRVAFKNSQIQLAISPGWAPRRLQNYQYGYPPPFPGVNEKGLISNHQIIRYKPRIDANQLYQRQL